SDPRADHRPPACAGRASRVALPVSRDRRGRGPGRSVGGTMSARAVALATLATIATACTAAAVTASASGTLEPAPAGLREEVVLAGALVGRNRLALNSFKDPRPPEAVLKAVEAAWSNRPAPIRRDTRAGWLTLVQAVDGAVELLEVRAAPHGGSEGRRSRW